MKFQLLIKTNLLKNKLFFAFKLSDVVFIMLINVKMPTIVGILTFMSKINFMLSSFVHEKSFITTEPEQLFVLQSMVVNTSGYLYMNSKD